MSRLYWARNDGMSGHVWLSERDQARLAEEMLLQGMSEFPIQKFARGEEMHVTMTEIEAALATASSAPVALEDRRLWEDWLEFLRGAATNGGLLVR
jgi:hypothetical protein